MKDLGELHHFLGVHVQRYDDGLLLSHRQYMMDILDRAGTAECKLCAPLRLIATPRPPLMVLLC